MHDGVVKEHRFPRVELDVDREILIEGLGHVVSVAQHAVRIHRLLVPQLTPLVGARDEPQAAVFYRRVRDRQPADNLRRADLLVGGVLMPAHEGASVRCLVPEGGTVDHDVWPHELGELRHQRGMGGQPIEVREQQGRLEVELADRLGVFAFEALHQGPDLACFLATQDSSRVRESRFSKRTQRSWWTSGCSFARR